MSLNLRRNPGLRQKLGAGRALQSAGSQSTAQADGNSRMAKGSGGGSPGGHAGGWGKSEAPSQTTMQGEILCGAQGLPNRFSFFVLIFKDLFENQSYRERVREFPSASLLPKWIQQSWASLQPEAKSFICVSHVGGRGLNTVSRSETARSQTRVQRACRYCIL